jgi:hypothetical protein
VRLAPAVLVTFVSLGFASRLTAQPAAHLAEVTAESVVVRSGPSDKMPETGTLYRGARVVVDHEEGEHWVAIQPPRGQVSWIRHLFLKPPASPPADGMAYNAVVTSEGEVEVAVGRPGHNQPLDVRKTRIPDQTIVLVVGKKVEHDGSHWFPIEPPDGDFRYLPKSAVRVLRAQPAQAFVVRDNPKALPPESKPAFEPVTASIPGGAGGAVRPANWPNHPLWQQAEQAAQQGDYARAETLYLKLAAEMNQLGGDAELANLCYARVHAVREKQRGTPHAEPGRRDLPAAGQWVGPGVLRQTGLPAMNGRAVYAMDGAQGRTRCYAVAGSGVDLERFKGYEVQLYGELTYPGNLRGVGLLTVTRVQAAR